MASSFQYSIASLVHVDEFVIGGPEEQIRRRSEGTKKLIVLTLEILG